MKHADERELHLFDQHIVAQRLHEVAVDEILEQLIIFIQPVCIGGKEIRGGAKAAAGDTRVAVC